MYLDYYLFVATQWLGPAALMSLAALSVVAAIKRPAASTLLFCFSIFTILAGFAANHLALNTFGSHEISPNGGLSTRFEPTLRLIGLLSQVIGFAACFFGSILTIWSLAGNSAVPVATAAEPRHDNSM